MMLLIVLKIGKIELQLNSERRRLIVVVNVITLQKKEETELVTTYCAGCGERLQDHNVRHNPSCTPPTDDRATIHVNGGSVVFCIDCYKSAIERAITHDNITGRRYPK